MTMLEKAARALAAEDARRYWEETGKNIDLYSTNPDVFKRLARSVLMAVRVPDGLVVDAGEGHRSGYGHVTGFEPHSTEGIFTAMIDAILNEDQP